MPINSTVFLPAAREQGVYKVLHIFTGVSTTAILQNDFAKHLKESGKGLQCRILVFIGLKVPCKQLLILGCSLKICISFSKKEKRQSEREKLFPIPNSALQNFLLKDRKNKPDTISVR